MASNQAGSLDDLIGAMPFERRLLRLRAAVAREGGRPLPLSVVPLQYRNTALSRTLIALGLLPNRGSTARSRKQIK
jgi:hypothetical protein